METVSFKRNYNRFIKTRKSFVLFTCVGIGLVILTWFILSLGIHSALFPNPSDTFAKLGSMLTMSSTYLAIGGTLLRLLIAFLISFVLALILGIIGGLNKTFRMIFNPFIVLLRTLPTAAIIYTLIVLLKPVYSLYIITSLTMFPIMFEAVANGIENIDKEIVDQISVEANKRNIKMVVFIMIPVIFKNIMLGVMQALGLGMKVSIMAEVLCGTDTISGLGRIIYHGYIEGDMVTVFAISFVAIILIGIFDFALRFVKKKYIK